MNEITRLTEPDKVVEAVRTLAEADPDYVYQRPDTDGCYNVWKGEGSCIIGKALLMAGVPLEFLEAHDSTGIYSLADELGWDQHGDDDDNEVVSWLNMVQDQQDQGTAWGAAVLAADRGTD